MVDLGQLLVLNRMLHKASLYFVCMMRDRVIYTCVRSARVRRDVGHSG